MNEKPNLIKKTINIVTNNPINPKGYSSSFCITTPKDQSKINKEKTDNTPRKTNMKKDCNPEFNTKTYNEDNINNTSPTKKYMKIFEKFINLLQSARKDINDKSILSDYDELHGDIMEIYETVKPEVNPYKVEDSFEDEKTLSFIKSKMNEPTSLNIELIDGSSKRRKSIYKKFFDICQESVKDIASIFNVRMNYTKNITNNIPINIDQSVTNNVTNNNNKTKSNRVLFNVNLNVQNIRNISPGRKGHSSKPYRKQKSKKYFTESGDDSVDLSESQTYEGVSNRLPFTNYMVNKPKDDWITYKIFTEGDVFEESHEEKLKQKGFAKTRSKSQLNIKPMISHTFEIKNEPLKGNILPDSNTIVTESEGENDFSEENPSDEEKVSRKISDNSNTDNKNIKNTVESVPLKLDQIETQIINTKRDSKCLIF